jgi:hypothetical protein
MVLAPAEYFGRTSEAKAVFSELPILFSPAPFFPPGRSKKQVFFFGHEEILTCLV